MHTVLIMELASHALYPYSGVCVKTEVYFGLKGAVTLDSQHAKFLQRPLRIWSATGYDNTCQGVFLFVFLSTFHGFWCACTVIVVTATNALYKTGWCDTAIVSASSILGFLKRSHHDMSIFYWSRLHVNTKLLRMNLHFRSPAFVNGMKSVV